MTLNPFGPSSSWRSPRWGIMTTHGPHQVAQNSITYTLPGSNAFSSGPVNHLVAFNGGGGSPTLSVGGGLVGFGSAAGRRREPPKTATVRAKSKVRIMTPIVRGNGRP